MARRNSGRIQRSNLLESNSFEELNSFQSASAAYFQQQQPQQRAQTTQIGSPNEFQAFTSSENATSFSQARSPLHASLTPTSQSRPKSFRRSSGSVDSHEDAEYTRPQQQQVRSRLRPMSALVGPSFQKLIRPRVMAQLRELEVQYSDSELYTSTQQVFFPDISLARTLGQGRFTNVYKVVLGAQTTLSSPSSDMEADDDDIDGSKPLSMLSIASATTAPQMYTGGQVVALKSLSARRLLQASKSGGDISNLVINAARELFLEAHLLAQCQHPNIVQLQGVAAEGLVGSFSTNPDVPARGHYGYFQLLDLMGDTLEERIPKWKAIQQSRRIGVFRRGSTGAPPATTIEHHRHQDGVSEKIVESKGNLHERYSVATAIASALQYLHSHGIVVRDLSPKSVGFDALTGKVNFFDLKSALPLENCFLEIQLAGNFRYMAPENMLCQPSGYPSDVYSFGVLLWEIITMERPYEAYFTMDKQTKKEVFSQSKFTDQVILNKQWRPSCSGINDAETKRLIKECWCGSPEARPNAKQVAWRLENSIILQRNTSQRRASQRRSTQGARSMAAAAKAAAMFDNELDDEDGEQGSQKAGRGLSRRRSLFNVFQRKGDTSPDAATQTIQSKTPFRFGRRRKSNKETTESKSASPRINIPDTAPTGEETTTASLSIEDLRNRLRVNDPDSNDVVERTKNQDLALGQLKTVYSSNSSKSGSQSSSNNSKGQTLSSKPKQSHSPPDSRLPPSVAHVAAPEVDDTLYEEERLTPARLSLHPTG